MPDDHRPNKVGNMSRDAAPSQTHHLRYIQFLIARFNLRTIQNTKTYNINL